MNKSQILLLKMCMVLGLCGCLIGGYAIFSQKRVVNEMKTSVSVAKDVVHAPDAKDALQRINGHALYKGIPYLVVDGKLLKMPYRVKPKMRGAERAPLE